MNRFDYTLDYKLVPPPPQAEAWAAEISEEIARLQKEFSGADEHKLEALAALFEQAAYERIYLKRMNCQAMYSGLVKIHPTDPSLQRVLPLSGEIARHSAALTNITDKLLKHLGAADEDEGDELSEYE